jgi:superfamily II DNA or RNA helicase
MTSFLDLTLKPAYHKPEDDIARDFYLPAMAAATRYDRAVGYFSSAIYVLAWPSLKQFIVAGGQIRIICSPVLAEGDVDAIAEGYESREYTQGALLRTEFQRLANTPGLVKPARVLASLVAIGALDIRIAWVGDSATGRSKRLFHDKVGIFTDAQGNSIAFKGSMNETWPGLALDGNLESVDVFVTWAGVGESARVKDEESYFHRLWENEFPGVVTIALPEVTRSELIRAADLDHWPELVDDICIEIQAAQSWAPVPKTNARTPRAHQVAALEAWKQQGRRGIFEHATGSGKTFTALCAIKDAFTRNEVVLVLVPSDLLLKQWSLELRSTFGDQELQLLVCGGGRAEWRQAGQLRSWVRQPTNKPRVILASLQTASSEEFIQACRGGPHLFFVADEVHRLGAANAQRVFGIQSGPRLGLSATPRRAGDPAGTAAIFDYFEGVVPPPFTLFDAIESGTLTPYAYHVHRVSLESDEQEGWGKLTAEIQRLYARSKSPSNPNPDIADRVKHLLIRRARIVKSASQKVPEAVNIVMAHYNRGEHWIVYCDDQTQLGEVRDGLRNAGCRDVLEYHTGMAGDAAQTLTLFENSGGVIVSIRCLDEGVDIPAVSHALILASSKNPREYVQRRGRVLRRYGSKYVSHIHDVLVTPIFDPDEPPSTAILEGELARAIEFGSRAINPACVTDLERLAIEHHLDWRKISDAGVEDDDMPDEENDQGGPP